MDGRPPLAPHPIPCTRPAALFLASLVLALAPRCRHGAMQRGGFETEAKLRHSGQHSRRRATHRAASYRRSGVGPPTGSRCSVQVRMPCSSGRSGGEGNRHTQWNVSQRYGAAPASPLAARLAALMAASARSPQAGAEGVDERMLEKMYCVWAIALASLASVASPHTDSSCGCW
jgi:hypothetical protein